MQFPSEYYESLTKNFNDLTKTYHKINKIRHQGHQALLSIVHIETPLYTLFPEPGAGGCYVSFEIVVSVPLLFSCWSKSETAYWLLSEHYKREWNSLKCYVIAHANRDLHVYWFYQIRLIVDFLYGHTYALEYFQGSVSRCAFQVW